jgi:outer membrane protein assembly factor BamB
MPRYAVPQLLMLLTLTSLCLSACFHWPKGAQGVHQIDHSITRLNPESVKSFSPSWRQRLGLSGALLKTPNFIGGVALHATRPLIAVVGYDRRLQIRHQESGLLLWSEEMGSPGVGQPVFDGDLLLFATRDARLNAYHIQEREVKWRRQFNDLVRAPLTFDEKRIYLSDGSNSLYALNRKDGKILWQRKRQAPREFNLRGESKPLVHDGVVYMGFSDGYISAFSASSGQSIWDKDLAPQTQSFEDVDGDPVLSYGTLYVASAASGIYALNPKTGAQKWFHPIAGVVTMGEFEGDLIIGLQHGELGRFSPFNRQFIWRVRFGTDGAPTRTIRFPHGLITSLSRGAVYVLDAHKGTLRDQFNPGSGVLAPARLSEDGWLYLSSLNGFLYAFSPR